MNLQKFLNQDLQGNDEFVTDGNILLVKEAIQCKNILDYFYRNKINNAFSVCFEDMLAAAIPFESGDIVVRTNVHTIKHPTGTEFSLFKCLDDNACYAFDKEYIDFIERYIQPDHYTIIKKKYKGEHILKFWSFYGNFLGCLATCDIAIKV